MQPGAPPQGGGGLGIGMGGIGPGGIPRIKVSTGDYSPERLYAAVVTGEGFGNPRMLGLMMLGVAILFTIINTVLVLVVHIYYPYLYGVAAPLLWGGLWLLATGQPKQTQDGSPAALWTRAGLGVCLVVGILMGIAMCTFNWERMFARSAVNAATGSGQL
jgi:hypothetical protein